MVSSPDGRARHTVRAAWPAGKQEVFQVANMIAARMECAPYRNRFAIRPPDETPLSSRPASPMSPRR